MRTICIAMAVGSVAMIVFAGCGDSDDGRDAQTTPTLPTTSDALPPDAPMAQVIAKQFPSPKPTEGAPPGAMKSIEAGRKACKGKTPAQVRDEFIGAASGLDEGQEAMLGELGRFEKQSRTSPDFVAGQLAAGVYEATLPEEEARFGYQGCVYELALQLRKELAKKLPHNLPRTPGGGGHTSQGGVLGKPNSHHYSAFLRPGPARSGARQPHTRGYETASKGG
jgi:hypothetical protein